MKLRLPSLSSGFSELIKIFPESLGCSPLYLVRNPFYVISSFHKTTNRLLEILIFNSSFRAVRDFKCAWFDDRHYFEFFPLHAVCRRDGK